MCQTTIGLLTRTHDYISNNAVGCFVEKWLLSKRKRSSELLVLLFIIEIMSRPRNCQYWPYIIQNEDVQSRKTCVKTRNAIFLKRKTWIKSCLSYKPLKSYYWHIVLVFEIKLHFYFTHTLYLKMLSKP